MFQIYIYTIVLYALKRTPLKYIVEFYAAHKQWKALSEKQVKNARDDISTLHPRPEGHAWWNHVRPTEYSCDLSVIVPFYNTENYAKRCIDSILNQKTKFSVEVILIDDGSPDNCGVILDSYANIANVSVFHKTNGGLSDARNFGLQHANGKYVTFVDSDDYLPENALDLLMNKAFEFNADIVEGSYQTFDNANRIKTYAHDFKVLSKGKNMFGFAWGKVYKAELFEKFCFPVGYWFEDTVIAGLIFPESEVTVTIPEVVYQYYINQKGITHQAHTNPRSIDTYYIFEELYDTMEHYGIEITKTCQRAVVWQLSKYVYARCQYIGEEHLKSLFVLCAELAEKYGVLSSSEMEEYPFWAREVWESFIHKQYGRWKLASQML